MKNENSGNNILFKELESLLKKGNAHVSFNDAVKNIPFEDLGKKPGDLPYSIWQITEHIRIAQKDILHFSFKTNYTELSWPEDYWTKDTAPENEEAWKNSIKEINDDLNEFIALLKNAESIFMPLPHGSGQTLLREAVLIADHTSYHTGEIIILRRLLGNWKNN
ncbi:MAG: DinB family protein [Parafilimonas sp.]